MTKPQSSFRYSSRVAAQVEGHKAGPSFMPNKSSVQLSPRPSLLEMPREQYESLLRRPLKKQ